MIQIGSPNVPSKFFLKSIVMLRVRNEVGWSAIEHAPSRPTIAKEADVCEQKCQPEPLSSGIPVVPLPVALYVSDGLIFELYDGGRPGRTFVIRWERLKPREESDGTK